MRSKKDARSLRCRVENPQYNQSKSVAGLARFYGNPRFRQDWLMVSFQSCCACAQQPQDGHAPASIVAWLGRTYQAHNIVNDILNQTARVKPRTRGSSDYRNRGV